MLDKVLVSACLLGEPCRYDGKSCPNEHVIAYLKDKQVFAVCPEVMGGLPTPRTSCELINKKAISVLGEDRTKEYVSGANQVLKLVKTENIRTAVLKSKSPSCGYKEVYDGTFTKKTVRGNGICAELLENNGLIVINSDKIAFKNKNEKKKPL